jgi:hypothetical protein
MEISAVAIPADGGAAHLKPGRARRFPDRRVVLTMIFH